MRPIDALTNIDRTTIANYLSVCGNVECGPMEIVLKEWNKNKTKLFKAFGRKLRISKQISIPKDRKVIASELNTIYHPYIFYLHEDIQAYINNPEQVSKMINNKFIEDVLLFWAKKNYCEDDLYTLSRLFAYGNLIEGHLCSFNDKPYSFQNFKCTIKNGMKTIRTIQKVLKATGYPRIDLFNEWRNQVSLVQTNEVTHAKLVLSIHPIDFMTMSDNSCNWSSCMSWTKSGCYHAGTLEMMNSNVAAITYLEAESDYTILQFNDTGEIYPIPNKTWRSLVFIHKDIILCGKSYPYFKQDLCFQTLDFARQVVGENIHWNYKFINQEYQDMKNIEGNYYLRDWFNPYYDKKKKHHTITFYTNGMYNDIIESKYPYYYCCRNYVEEPLKICLSGPATCICCGKKLFEDSRSEIISYDDLGQDKICYSCKVKRRCRTCGKIHYHMKYRTKEGDYCSDDCVKDTVIFPLRNRTTCTKDQLAFNFNSIVACFYEPAEFEKPSELLSISESFKDFEKETVDDFIKKIEDTYKDKIRIYKVPFGLCGYRYADASRWGAEYTSKTFDGYYTLCMYNILARNNSLVEQNIINLKTRIPLLEYLGKEVN